MSGSDSLLCVFSAVVEERDGSYVIEVPKRELDLGDVERRHVYRVAMMEAGERDGGRQTATASQERNYPDPPVEVGETLAVEIEDVGDKGDGIARVGPGYIVFVPDTEVGERVEVEITEVRENMAFADVVERQDRFG